jgi:addiction module HigA family antidote
MSMHGSRMYNPPHPGEILRELYLEPLDLSITEAADGLGVSRNTLSELVNGGRGVSPEMALRLPSTLRPTVGWKCSRNMICGTRS